MKKNKIFPVFIFLVVFALLGYSRDFIFVNINILLYNKLRQAGYPVPYVLSFLNAYSYYTLYILKWVLTAGYVGLFFFIQRWLLRLIFEQKIVRAWLLYFYLILLLLSVLAFLAGYIFGNIEEGYGFARIFTGILQSPLPAMFLVPAAILKNKFFKEHNNQQQPNQ